MDRTEVGRLMSRLQGDVNALQEFLESTVFAIGDLVLLVGIIVILLTLNVPLGLMTLAIIPALLIVRTLWLPFARKAFLGRAQSSSTANGALAESINGVRLIRRWAASGSTSTCTKRRCTTICAAISGRRASRW